MCHSPGAVAVYRQSVSINELILTLLFRAQRVITECRLWTRQTCTSYYFSTSGDECEGGNWVRRKPNVSAWVLTFLQQRTTQRNYDLCSLYLCLSPSLCFMFPHFGLKSRTELSSLGRPLRIFHGTWCLSHAEFRAAVNLRKTRPRTSVIVGWICDNLLYIYFV